jgi:hypothetical protein
MPGSALRLLYNEPNARVLDLLPDALCLVSHDCVYVLRRKHLPRGRDHVREQRPAADFMQHLRMPGFETCAFSRRHDHYCGPRRGFFMAIFALFHCVQYTCLVPIGTKPMSEIERLISTALNYL